MKNIYQSIEKMHNEVQESISRILSSNEVYDISANHAILIYNIGDKDTTMTNLSKSYFGGRPIWHLVSHLVKHGYAEKVGDETNRRYSRITLSKKGLAFFFELCSIFSRLFPYTKQSSTEIEKALEVIETTISSRRH